jgi:hypothetical protein
MCHTCDLVRRPLSVKLGIHVQALAPAGHRERDDAHLGKRVLDKEGDCGALGQAGTFSRVQIEHHAVGVLHDAFRGKPPLRDVDLEGRSLGKPYQRPGIVDQRIDIHMILVLHSLAQYPLGRGGVKILLEKALAGLCAGSHPVNPSFAGCGPVPGPWDHHRGYLHVVHGHIQLGGPGFRIENLPGVREPDSASVHVQFLGGHGEPGASQRSGFPTSWPGDPPQLRPRATPATGRAPTFIRGPPFPQQSFALDSDARINRCPEPNGLSGSPMPRSTIGATLSIMLAGLFRGSLPPFLPRPDEESKPGSEP